MDVWFNIEKEPLLRGAKAELRNLKDFFPALLPSASGELLPS